MADFSLKKHEVPLAKIEPELAQHLKALRSAAPASAKYVSDTLFHDTMVPTVGNKLAWNDFSSRPRKSGVHVMIDGNDFGSINKQWGQSAGDDAIKAMFGALSSASRTFKGKLFRVGGDEGRAYFEKPEHAYAFVRAARQNLEALPPLQGQHHHSVSIGLGTTPETAEQALIEAKHAKKAGNYAPGHAQTHAHSLLPGSAGPVNVKPPSDIPKGFSNPKAASPVLGPAFTNPVHKSEDPEVQELLLRKFEMELSEMAVLHDDGNKPLPVWRVENDKGEGAMDIPLAKSAFLSSDAAEIEIGTAKLSLLRQEGFNLRRVLADKVWVSKSGRQVLIEPHKQ